jgi:FixJ family two-component response regulator
VLQAAGFTVVCFPSAEAFLENFDPKQIACLVLDIGLPAMNGAALQDEMQARGIKIPIVFLSGIADVPMATHLMKRGATNLLQKPFKDPDLVNAVTEAVMLAKNKQQEFEKFACLRKRAAELTARETEVARCVVNGMSNKQVGISLGISERTVEIHRGRVMRKMQAQSVAELARLWTQAFEAFGD